MVAWKVDEKMEGKVVVESNMRDAADVDEDDG